MIEYFMGDECNPADLPSLQQHKIINVNSYLSVYLLPTRKETAAQMFIPGARYSNISGTRRKFRQI